MYYTYISHANCTTSRLLTENPLKKSITLHLSIPINESHNRAKIATEIHKKSRSQ